MNDLVLAGAEGWRGEIQRQKFKLLSEERRHGGTTPYEKPWSSMLGVILVYPHAVDVFREGYISLHQLTVTENLAKR